ncbi:Uncharacterized protein TCM_037752 isoform 2, partial [Theobroma cacao]
AAIRLLFLINGKFSTISYFPARRPPSRCPRQPQIPPRRTHLHHLRLRHSSRHCSSRLRHQLLCYVYILQRRAALDESLPQESQRSTSIQGLLEKDSIAFVMMQGEFAE